MNVGEQEKRAEHRQNADDLTKQEHVELRIVQAFGKFDGKDRERTAEIKWRAVIVMAISNKVDDSLFKIFARREHLHYDGILREFIRLEERDHHLVFCAGVVGEDEDGEVNDADECENCKDTFLGGGHVAMIPFSITPSVLF